MDSPALTVREAAELLRVSRDLIYDLAAGGEIDHYRIRGRILIPREGVERFLRAHFHPGKKSFFHRRSSSHPGEQNNG